MFKNIFILFLSLAQEDGIDDDDEDIITDEPITEEVLNEPDDENNGDNIETGLVKESVVEVLKLKDEYKAVIVKWRKVVNKYSGRSTVDHDYLQNAIKEWQKAKVSNIGHLYNSSYICMVGCAMLYITYHKFL